jgi:metal transporter CNNM
MNLGTYSMNAHASPGEEFGSPEFWAKMLVSILLVLLGGVFAG